MKKILISIDPDSGAFALCDMTNVKTKSDYETCLRAVFDEDDFEIDDDTGTEWFFGITLDDAVSSLKSERYVEIDSDGTTLQVINISKVLDPFAKAKKKATKRTK